jgi:hypothetical protein
MRFTRCLVIAALLLAPGLGLWGCSDDTDKPLDLGVTDTTPLPDGPSVDKRIFLDAPPFLDQGPDLAPDMAVDAALPDAPLPDKDCGKIACNCTYNGHQLWGRVQFVTSFEDIKVREVTALQDLKVQKVTALPNSCGKWQIVTSLPDLKVRVVTALEDIKIRYVTALPGI